MNGRCYNANPGGAPGVPPFVGSAARALVRQALRP
jgi:hypothetical protein